MVKYFRIALTTAMLGGLAMPAFAQLTPQGAPVQSAPAGELAPDAAKPATHAVTARKLAHRQHRAATRHGVAKRTVKPEAAPAA